MIRTVVTVVKVLAFITVAKYASDILSRTASFRSSADVRGWDEGVVYVSVFASHTRDICAIDVMATPIVTTMLLIPSLFLHSLKCCIKIVLSIVDGFIGAVWDMVPILNKFSPPRLARLIKL